MKLKDLVGEKPYQVWNHLMGWNKKDGPFDEALKQGQVMQTGSGIDALSSYGEGTSGFYDLVEIVDFVGKMSGFQGAYYGIRLQVDGVDYFVNIDLITEALEEDIHLSTRMLANFVLNILEDESLYVKHFGDDIDISTMVAKY